MPSDREREGSGSVAPGPKWHEKHGLPKIAGASPAVTRAAAGQKRTYAHNAASNSGTNTGHQGNASERLLRPEYLIDPEVAPSRRLAHEIALAVPFGRTS